MTDSNVASRDSETAVSGARTEYADPIELSTDVTMVHGVALVTCRIRNRTPVPRGVRVIDQLDGPTLPPRSNGVSAAGWTDSTHETVVPAGETAAVGYACPLDEKAVAEKPVGEPVELDAVGPPSLTDRDDTEELVAHARRLGDGRPPRDAIPTAEADTIGSRDGEKARSATDADNDGVGTAGVSRADTIDSDDTETTQPPFADGICPVPVETYFDEATTRVRRAEATTDGSVESVTAAFRRSHHTPVTLEQAVARDEAALRAIAERATELADRAAETDVPVDPLRRLV